MRAVSLVPSITESLLAWGVVPTACTKYCEQPDLLHVGGTKNPDVDAIVGLEPDIVFMDRVENRKEDAEALRAAGVRVVDIDVRTLADVGPELAIVARAVGVDVMTDPVPAVTDLGQTAFVPIWRRPWMTIGPDTYGSTVLEALGITNVFADADSDFPEVDLAGVAARAPDLVLVPSEPYEFTDDHLSELGSVGSRVVRVDGQDLFWWGTRTPSALLRLHRALISI